MKYGDEKIAELLNRHKKGIHGDLETGLYIKEEVFHFRRVSFCANKFSMMIPLRLQPADESYLEAVYKNDRPDAVLCHRRRNMTMQITKLDVSDDLSASDFLDKALESIAKLKTGLDIFEKDKMIVNGIEIAWCDYKSLAIDSVLYNMFMLMDINKEKYQVAFFCNVYEGAYWREVLKRMFSSIELNEYKEGGVDKVD